ncbi:helix-turn-helix domain-containing protein [Mycolicibacterium fortuitum]|uniref:helix-turn-helix domain-containing protein n=1 Tax=Mycolicibacterium fortuitum TaxID=1766 RepID=UPI0034CDAB9A
MSENDMVTEQLADTVDESPLHTVAETAAVPEPPKLYTMEEAADRLRVSREYLYRMRKSGDLIVVKFGRRVLVESAEIDRVIAAARTAA